MAETLKKILIAEDEASIARALELKLTKLGYEVALANNGEVALRLLKQQSFNLLLLDLIMPVLDGFGVLEAMKAEKIKVPVLVCSNLGQDEDIKKAKALGASDYIVKSDTPISQIVQRIEKIIK
ncbi:MAG TPA: response regulator [bacterium]|nr:response regulator [bacterium]HPT30000.1 response regulator [bacterium]